MKNTQIFFVTVALFSVFTLTMYGAEEAPKKDKQIPEFGFIIEHLPDPLYDLLSEEVGRIAEELAKDIEIGRISITEFEQAYRVKAEEMRKAKASEAGKKYLNINAFLSSLKERDKEKGIAHLIEHDEELPRLSVQKIAAILQEERKSQKGDKDGE